MQPSYLPERQDREPQPMMSIVKSAISSLTSLRNNQNGKPKSEKALALSKNYSPAETLCAYDAGLQSKLPGLCPSIHLATEMKQVPTLKVLAEAYDEETYIIWMKAQLIKINEFVGTKEKLSTDQMEELAIQILHEYGYLNLFEFIIFCGRLRSGSYEEFYGSVDPMRVLKSLKSFCYDRRCDLDKVYREREAEQKRLEEKNRVAISFDEWYESLTPEKQEEVKVNLPAFYVPYMKRKEAQKNKS